MAESNQLSDSAPAKKLLCLGGAVPKLRTLVGGCYVKTQGSSLFC